MERFFILVLLIVVVLSPASHAQTGNADKNRVFESKVAGFRVTKPESWHDANAEDHLRNLERTKLADEKIHKLLLRFTTTPLVMFTKHKEPHDDVNPSFKMIIKPLGKLDGSNPMKIANMAIGPMKMFFSNFTLKTMNEVFVSGRKAAYAHIVYDLETQAGLKFRTSSELWIVPRDKHFYLIGAGRKFGDAEAKKEIRTIIESISFF